MSLGSQGQPSQLDLGTVILRTKLDKGKNRAANIWSQKEFFFWRIQTNHHNHDIRGVDVPPTATKVQRREEQGCDTGAKPTGNVHKPRMGTPGMHLCNILGLNQQAGRARSCLFW